MLVAEQALEREIDGLLLFELEEATWREMGMVGSTGTQSPETVHLTAHVWFLTGRRGPRRIDANAQRLPRPADPRAYETAASGRRELVQDREPCVMLARLIDSVGAHSWARHTAGAGCGLIVSARATLTADAALFRVTASASRPQRSRAPSASRCWKL
jgi:hypothetical protein